MDQVPIAEKAEAIGAHLAAVDRARGFLDSMMSSYVKLLSASPEEEMMTPLKEKLEKLMKQISAFGFVAAFVAAFAIFIRWIIEDFIIEQRAWQNTKYCLNGHTITCVDLRALSPLPPRPCSVRVHAVRRWSLRVLYSRLIAPLLLLLLLLLPRRTICAQVRHERVQLGVEEAL